MIKISKLIIVFLLVCFYNAEAQKAGYYNGTEGKTGTELKTALHEIIKGHIDFSYSDAKYILNYADQDPANPLNILYIYSRLSVPISSWGGTGSMDPNREHVWAKSHGNFADVRPMDGDAFNLHPEGSHVNILRSNYDFDECSATGTLIPEANAYYTSTQFEPQDAAKGEAARTLFYMATRYEGTDGEIDLEMIDQVGNYPNPKFGKLSTLLQWNNDFPPTDNERRRNERVSEAQKNRNPFIDYPDYANMIWGATSAPAVSISNMEMVPEFPTATESANITSAISSTGGPITSATLYYGNTYNSTAYSVGMAESAGKWDADIDFTHFAANTMVFYKISATDGTNTSVTYGNYRIPANKTYTPIASVQGTETSSPMVGTTVTVAGIVTANLDNTYYIQGTGSPYNGMCIFDIKRGRLGDSVVVTGDVSEYSTLTELGNVSYFFDYGHKRDVVPTVLSINQVNESYEGMLVTFKNVTFLDGDKIIPLSTSTNLSFTDGSASMIAFARYGSRISGKLLPSGTVDVTGVISQYSGAYQLLINNISDIKAGFDDEAPIIAGVVVNDKDWIQVSFNEKVDKTSAENISNYTFDNGLQVAGAYIYGGTSVLLLVNGIQQTDYILTVNGVLDLQGNAMVNVTKGFHSDFASPKPETVHCLNDTIETTDLSQININVIANDTLPVNYSVNLVRLAADGGIATVQPDYSINYETTIVDKPVINDTLIYQVCNLATPYNCSEGTVYVTLNFSTSINKIASAKIIIFPNPASDELHITSEKLVSTLEITDLNGKIIYVGNPLKLQFSIPMPEKKGLYFIRITTEKDEIIMRKITKY